MHGAGSNLRHRGLAGLGLYRSTAIILRRVRRFRRQGIGCKIRDAMEMMTKLARAGALLILSVLALSAAGSPAQPWPQRIVKLMVPLGPGSGADVTAR